MHTFTFTDMLHLVLSEMLADKGFCLPSVEAQKARKTAESLIVCGFQADTEFLLNKFLSQLIAKLKGCFHESRSVRVRREKMWENLFQLRSSPEFIIMWKKFLQDSLAEADPSPIFFQYITDRIFDKLARQEFPLTERMPIERCCLDDLEKSALRYTVGSVIFALEKKLSRSCHPMKESLKLCLKDLEEESGNRAIVIVVYQ